ncbi:hypothetical protein [Streptomyces sp. NPDC093260]|uniref:DUF6907 domain-containing protein n=1 Tax=Streptomyces sp. NPDC093260 TaxID=3155073 RepID=UPI0034190EE4
MSEDEKARRFVDRHFPEVARLLAARTVTVTTIDHGDVTVYEPAWCLGVHPTEGYRADIEHRGQPIRLKADTACHGEVEVLDVFLYQRPFAEQSSTAPVAVVALDEWHEFDAAQLAEFGAALTAFVAGPLHDLAEQLRLLEGGEQ